ncbi:MAG TPA: AAA family ATPase [Longimicrobium sp.]|nr:AAA family ATPase [Longimicrobium sp.]
MSKRFRRGLVVGKFAPLHRGHELLIGRALDECDEVIVISYQSPEFPGYPAEVRERWLAARFPQTTRLVLTEERLRAITGPGGPRRIPPNDGDPVEDRRFCGYLCQQVLGVTVDAVFTSEEYGDPFAAELTRYFRQTQPDAPEVRHVLVDRARERLPVSGTLLRADPHRHRRYLSAEVYASFVRRVCLLGGESTGKSTLAMTLARELGTEWVPEYGREIWMEKGGVLDFEDMEHIGRTQIRDEEEAAGRAERWIICDTSPLTTLFYSHQIFGRAAPALEQMAERAYDLTVLCVPDFAFVQDGTRHGGDFRHQQHAWYLRELESRGIPFLHATGSLDERVAQVGAAMESIDAIRGASPLPGVQAPGRAGS